MLRTKYMLMTLTLALSSAGCAPMGCSGENPDHDLSATEQAEGLIAAALPAPTPGASMYGTWLGDVHHTGMFAKLVLMTDGRYHGERNVVCVKDPCPAIAEDDTFALYARETKTFFGLTPNGSKVPEMYEYVYSSREFKIRPLRPGSEWFPMVNAGSAWCAITRDCAGQALPPGPCAGGWVCGEKNICKWDCPRPSEATGDDMGTKGAIAQPQRPDACPAVNDCVMAANQCAKSPRNTDSCTTDALCKRCNPDGLMNKPVPEQKDPQANPVLKQ